MMSSKEIACRTIDIVKNEGLTALDEFANILIRENGCEEYWEFFDNLTLGKFLLVDFGDEWLNYATREIIMRLMIRR